MAWSKAFVRFRYHYLPDHVIGELLAKRWMDNLIPFASLVLVIAIFYPFVPDLFAAGQLSNLGRQFAEFGLVTLGLAIVMLSGGIDLSVGSVFAVSVLVGLICVNVWELPIWQAFIAVIAVGAGCGLINGFAIGYLRLRAFLTTLVTLVIFRSLYEFVIIDYSTAIVANMVDSDLWDFLGVGAVAGVPFSLIITLTIAFIWHIVLSRMRPGWRLQAVGGARRSAYNAGINVRRTVCGAYVWSGLLTALAGFLFAARLGSTGSDTGVGLEIQALTAVVLGGISLGGGRGSVAKAAMGSIFVLILTNSLITLGIGGAVSSLILGVVLIVAVYVDVRWLKNRHKLLNKVYVSPTYAGLGPAMDTSANSASPFAVNDKLRNVEIIGCGLIEGPEDVILDREGNLYCGNRHGDIIRFSGPDFADPEVIAHVGGHPLGLAFDPTGNLLVCIGGMGLYQVSPDRVVSKLTDETNRSLFSVIDDSRLRLADDLDVAPDGRVFFSEATIRYEMHDWAVDALESRGNGRIICYDPRTGRTRTEIRGLVFPNGICMASDGQSFFFAESWACRVSRYWFDGPKKGQVERVLENLPGYPDNINRASDGCYWVALLGMRSPALDVALRRPGFRRRMARRVAQDNWIFPNINTGCVAKFSEQGEILESLWDLGGENHPMITSMREHKGYLYLGGIYNNRIGRYRIPGADPNWCSLDDRGSPT
ncbi:MAG: SMP-30/gluconolactonase/LRE family protein [Notoacmeibacter sp.]|nr:SMP-30/gluconolactonase/LRE family protein [Notoacmeibacter sp.]